MNKPFINVTPLIDVLLVLLIIFMVISPLKPAAFEAIIPLKPNDSPDITVNKDSLVVALESDSSLRLNDEKDLGTAEDTGKIVERLKFVFKERSENLLSGGNVTGATKVEKTVFIKAPRRADYGSVAKVIDAVKISGADPVSLQIDDLQ